MLRACPQDIGDVNTQTLPRGPECGEQPDGQHDRGDPYRRSPKLSRRETSHFLCQTHECTANGPVGGGGARLSQRFRDFRERAAQFHAEDNRVAVVRPQTLERRLVAVQRFPADRLFER